jgi:hypothetical protein
MEQPGLSLGQREVTALVLQEFYNTVQVMIGEATSVSELKAFIQEKGGDLLSPGTPP